jgi:hypothetical protein
MKMFKPVVRQPHFTKEVSHIAIPWNLELYSTAKVPNVFGVFTLILMGPTEERRVSRNRRPSYTHPNLK